jgi:hypothetical protein
LPFFSGKQGRVFQSFRRQYFVGARLDVCWATNFNSVYDSISVFLLFNVEDICFHNDYQQGVKVNLVNDKFFSAVFVGHFKQFLKTIGNDIFGFFVISGINAIKYNSGIHCWWSLALRYYHHCKNKIRFRLGGIDLVSNGAKRFGSLLIETK